MKGFLGFQRHNSELNALQKGGETISPVGFIVGGVVIGELGEVGLEGGFAVGSASTAWARCLRSWMLLNLEEAW